MDGLQHRALFDGRAFRLHCQEMDHTCFMNLRRGREVRHSDYFTFTLPYPSCVTIKHLICLQTFLYHYFMKPLVRRVGYCYEPFSSQDGMNQRKVVWNRRNSLLGFTNYNQTLLVDRRACLRLRHFDTLDNKSLYLPIYLYSYQLPTFTTSQLRSSTIPHTYSLGLHIERAFGWMDRSIHRQVFITLFLIAILFTPPY